MPNDFQTNAKMILGEALIKKLIADTEIYWEGPGRGVNGRLAIYREQLLLRELKAAYRLTHESNGRLGEGYSAARLPPPLPSKDSILVLLVGFSIEPLVQSILVYCPARILLVLNKNYGDLTGEQMGKAFVGAVRDHLGHSPPEWLPKDGRPWPPEFISDLDDDDQPTYSPCSDKPLEIFRFLLHHLKSASPGQVMIDITGAKKSMVSAAYLFGALTGQGLSYVDFDDYSEKYHRPYGYSCLIGPLQNPYDAFRLSNWNRVRRDYENYNLGAAVEGLEDVIQAMKVLTRGDETRDVEASESRNDGCPEEGNQSVQKQKVSPEVDALENLKLALEFYRAWDAADLPGAVSLLDDWVPEGLEIPEVVRQVGPPWRQNKPSKKNTSGVIFLEAEMNLDFWIKLFGSNHWGISLCYARDELAKIRRLVDVKRDWRTAFMRAANVSEFLLKLRLLILAYQDHWIESPDHDLPEVFRSLQCYDAIIALENLLNPNKNKVEISYKPKDRPRGFLVKAIISKGAGLFEHTQVRQKDRRILFPDKDELNHLNRIRNKTFHNLTVITEGDSKRAVLLVEENWNYVIEHWLLLARPPLGANPFLQLIPIVPLDKTPTPEQDRQRCQPAGYSLPAWEDLLSICQVDFLPR